VYACGRASRAPQISLTHATDARTEVLTYDGAPRPAKVVTPVWTSATFVYDGADQLTTRRTGTDPALASTYDGDGNTLSDGSVTWAYDLNNRVKTTTNTASGTMTWARDGEGNITARTRTGLSTTYEYDLNQAVPRLTGLTLTPATGPATTQAYRYDPLGRVATLSETTGTTGTSTSTAAHDVLGAPTDLINAAGVVTRATDWTAYGTVRTRSGHPPRRRARPAWSPTPAYRPAGRAGPTPPGTGYGNPVVVFVAKEGPYQGRVLSAVVPDARQMAQWGLP
jgi:YD repeat-containing protein